MSTETAAQTLTVRSMGDLHLALVNKLTRERGNLLNIALQIVFSEQASRDASPLLIGEATETFSWNVPGPKRSLDEADTSNSPSPESLFREHYEALTRSLSLITADPDLARDAVQEAFARLCEDWERVGTYEHQVAWVRKVAINLVRDRQRFLQRRMSLLSRMGEQLSAQTRGLPADTDPLLWQAVRALPTRQRTVVALHYVGDLTLREVAESMDISEGSVKRHLDRARNTLRRKMEAE